MRRLPRQRLSQTLIRNCASEFVDEESKVILDKSDPKQRSNYRTWARWAALGEQRAAISSERDTRPAASMVGLGGNAGS
jgi:hypothetical protein